MYGTICDLVALVLIAGMTWALTSEGLWGAALMFFNSLFAAMITMNFYEIPARLIAEKVDFLSGYGDALCILLIFTVTLLILRLITENFAPAMVRFPMPLYHAGRFIFGVLGAAVTMGMIMIALDASPVHKKILGAMDYKYEPFFKIRLDKEILAFFQHETGRVFTARGPADPYHEFGNVNAFDPKGDWLLRTEIARPYPKGDNIFDDEAAGPAADGAAPKEGAAPAGGAAPNTNPGMPGLQPPPTRL